MTFDPSLKVGGKVKRGQRIGYIGKEGSSGGWSHLHFDIQSLQPSGEWGCQDSYAFLWQAYREQFDPAIIAVARPHMTVLAGETVELDASRSWAKNGIRNVEWMFSNGKKAVGSKVNRVFDQPGNYSETVKVTDISGNIDYDFARVNVFPEAVEVSPTIMWLHVAFYPTFGIKPGDPVVFRSRGLIQWKMSEDIYDFGDGTPKVKVPSNIDIEPHAAIGYGTVIHHYKKPGDYIVRVERRDTESDWKAIEQLHITVKL